MRLRVPAFLIHRREGSQQPLLVVVILAAVASACALGYVSGINRGVRKVQRSQVQFDLVVSVGLNDLAERGDLEALKGKLRFLIYANVSEYDRLVGQRPITNASFARSLAAGRVIWSQMKTQVVTVDSLINSLNTPTNR